MKGIVYILLILLTCIAGTCSAQGLSVSKTGVTDPNAMLDVAATSKGVLIPRIDYNNRPTAGVASGMLIYVTANGPEGNNAFYYYNGTAWNRYTEYSDVQSLSLSNDTLSISSANSVDLSNVFPVSGFTKCGSRYYNLSTDMNNCGSCGHACATGHTCSGGVCH